MHAHFLGSGGSPTCHSYCPKDKMAIEVNRRYLEAAFRAVRRLNI